MGVGGSCLSLVLWVKNGFFSETIILALFREAPSEMWSVYLSIAQIAFHPHAPSVKWEPCCTFLDLIFSL